MFDTYLYRNIFLLMTHFSNKIDLAHEKNLTILACNFLYYHFGTQSMECEYFKIFDCRCFFKGKISKELEEIYDPFTDEIFSTLYFVE